MPAFYTTRHELSFQCVSKQPGSRRHGRSKQKPGKSTQNKDSKLRKSSHRRPSEIVQLTTHINRVSLPGFNRMLMGKKKSCKSAIWFAICIVILVCCFYQIAERVRHYLCTPLAVSVTYKGNITLAMPCMTICPADEFGRSPAISKALLRQIFGDVMYSDVYDLMNKTDLTIGQIWNISRLVTHNVVHMMVEDTSLPYGNKLNRGKDALKMEMITTVGKCLTFKPIKPELHYHGSMTSTSIGGLVDDPSENFSLYKVITHHSRMASDILQLFIYRFQKRVEKLEQLLYVHPEEDIPLVKLFVAYWGIYPDIKKLFLIYVRVHEVIHVNLSNSPCAGGPEVVQCKMACIERKIYSNTTRRCRLPFMRERRDIPECKSPDELRTMFDTTDHVLRNFAPDKCPCPRKCRETLYLSETALQTDITESEEQVQLIFAENRVEVTEEYIAYNLAALFSDIGGGMGLFLGICILTVFEILEIFLEMVVPYFFLFISFVRTQLRKLYQFVGDYASPLLTVSSKKQPPLSPITSLDSIQSLPCKEERN